MYYFREVLEEEKISGVNKTLYLIGGTEFQLGVRVTEPLEIQTPKDEFSLKKHRLAHDEFLFFHNCFMSIYIQIYHF